MKLLLDTHVWYWFVIGDKTLTSKVIHQINHAAQEDTLYLAAISIWELAMLESKQRICFQLPIQQWIDQALKNIPLQLIDLHPSIAIESCQLEGFHGDPADRMIVATARVENLTLITRDKNIQTYAKQHKVKVISA